MILTLKKMMMSCRIGLLPDIWSSSKFGFLLERVFSQISPSGRFRLLADSGVRPSEPDLARI